MSDTPDSMGIRLNSRSGMGLELNANGALRWFDCNGLLLNLFLGNEIEGGPTNLYLRRLSDEVEWTPLLGPLSHTRFHLDEANSAIVGIGSWLGINYSIALVLAQGATAWFWHVRLENTSSTSQRVDLTYAQDLALASYGAVRLNEFYVSQYIDHTPLSHAARGTVIASRQNQAVDGRNPWCLIGSLRTGNSFATDALQLHGFSTRAGTTPPGLAADLPSHRLQHEHSMVVLRDESISLAPNARVDAGYFGSLVANHPGATSASDLERVDEILALLERTPAPFSSKPASNSTSATLFSSTPLLRTHELDTEQLKTLFGSSWRHEERDDRGTLLSFFHGADAHVVLKAKELRVLRPHGHLLRTGRHLTPDESALTSTCWMSGVFHSMLTQGHVSINRFLSTVHSYISLFRSHGQRVFVEAGGKWHLLDVPSAFEIAPDACRWIYQHDKGVIQVRAEARSEPHELALTIEVTSGEPTRFLISNHVALNGDDGSTPGAALWKRDGNDILLTPKPGSELAHRFPNGSFRISPARHAAIEQVGGDELLFADGQSRQQPFLCIITQPARAVGLNVRGHLLSEESPQTLRAPALAITAPSESPLAKHLSRIADIVPWYTHNALVHYLSPRGLEQYSGGGWGTRDVCQGPVELLLALGHIEPIRDLLLRVMSQQNPDGDWPQWFMFFERERNIRPGDSHGDVVFWPLLVLAQYLTASGDKGVLDERVPFFNAPGTNTVWEHAERALKVIEARVIPGTALAAYGHGDWNDSLQPADPSMRDHMCSAWTVTLHFQILTTLAHALRGIGRDADADRLEKSAHAVKQDFQRLLVVDDVLTGYALFEDAGKVGYLLHPRDNTTGVHYSSLAMIHAILEDLLTPEQTREHLRLIDTHLSAPDGVRLFDRPMKYHGGPQRFFQRAESATYFGREIGLMYMHAHLRYAQALAHIGEAERFFRAVCQASPIGIRSIVPTATLRQANCYYSSSDAVFDDRYQASEEYDRVVTGKIALDGGWRVYSSGAGIALGLIVRRFLGLSTEAQALSIDPVIPATLNGLRVNTTLLEKPIEVQYEIGSSGCGVKEITLNDAPLPFKHAENPHRLGAALIPRRAFEEKLAPQSNVLKIKLG